MIKGCFWAYCFVFEHEQGLYSLLLVSIYTNFIKSNKIQFCLKNILYSFFFLFIIYVFLYYFFYFSQKKQVDIKKQVGNCLNRYFTFWHRNNQDSIKVDMFHHSFSHELVGIFFSFITFFPQRKIIIIIKYSI